MHWICPLYKLSTCWAQQVERIWTPCWEMLSDVESCWGKFETGQTFRSTLLNISFVSQPSMRGSAKSSAFAQQRSTRWAHARPVPSVSKDSQPWFSLSLCEIFGLLNMLSNCWGHLNTALNKHSTCWELVQWTNPMHLHAALRTTAKQVSSCRWWRDLPRNVQTTKQARAKRAKVPFIIVEHANLWRFCRRRRLGCLVRSFRNDDSNGNYNQSNQ